MPRHLLRSTLACGAALLLPPLFASFPLASSGLPGHRVEAQVVLEAPEHDLVITISGRVQPRFEFDALQGGEDRSSFFLRRVRPEIRGQVFDERLTFKVDVETARSATLRDAWVDYAFTRGVRIRFGQHQAPFQWHRFVSARRQHFVERGVPSEAFGFPTGRDIGLMVHGRNAGNDLGYAVGFYDGAGRNIRESDSPGNMASARVVRAILGEIPGDETDFRRSSEPNLAFGLGAQGAWKNAVRDWSLGRSPVGDRRGDWITGTAFGHLAWDGLSLAADGYLRAVSPDDPTVDGYGGWAYMLSAGYALVAGRLEAVARFSELKLDRNDPATKEREWGLGLNLYQVGHLSKTRLQWLAHRTARAVGSGTDHAVIVEQNLQF